MKHLLNTIVFCIGLLCASCNTPTGDKYFKDDADNFMLSILSQEDPIYLAIEKDWKEQFDPDEGSKYDIFITEEYFDIKDNLQEIRLVNAVLFTTDKDNDRFIGSKDYICYHSKEGWNVNWVKNMNEEEVERMKQLLNDSLVREFILNIKELGDDHDLKFFKKVSSNNNIPKEILDFLDESISVTLGTKKGNILDYMSNKAKKQALQENGYTYADFEDLKLNTTNEDYCIFSIYECKKLFSTVKSDYYAAKVAFASSEKGSRFFSIVTDKYIVAKEPNKTYMVATDQADLIDEELDNNNISLIETY